MGDYKLRGEFSSVFWENLDSAKLKSIIQYAADPSNGLDVQLRGNYINIYYKGGNALEVRPKSFDFDKFYFYNGCKKNDLSTRKTVIEEAAKGKANRTNLISQVAAQNIIDELETDKNKHLELLNKSPKIYFTETKKVIDEWLKVQKKELGISHDEKAAQHKISMSNKNFDYSELVVIDLEYEISQKASFAMKGHNPRPDIIAVDKNGGIHVMELKFGLGAVNGKAGVDAHYDDFTKTIGKDPNGDFVNEMSNLIDSKKNLNLIDGRCFVNTTIKPVFDLVFRGTQSYIDEFQKRFGSKDVNKIYYLKEENDYILK